MTDDTHKDTLQVYEVGYHLVPTLKEEELDGAVGGVRSCIEKMGGSFIAEGAPALTKLTYSMSSTSNGKRILYDRGYFGWIKFKTLPEKARTLGGELQKCASVIRTSVYKTVREDTRAKIKMPLREIRRTDTLKVSPRTEVSAA